MYKVEKTKIHFVFVGMLACFLLVLSKAFVVQVVNKKELQHRYERQFFRVSKVYPNRGNIYDRNGEPLAINVLTYSIFTIPKNVKGGMEIYRKLSEIVPRLTFERIKKKIHNRSNYTFLARKITLEKDQVKQIQELGSEGGIYIEAVPKRTYPNHELLSQLLGIVGVDNIGLSGVEYQFNEQLKGTARITKYIQDAKGRPIKFQSQKVNRDSEDIYLSIDIELQAVAEKALRDAVIEFNADRGGIGVLDSKTGEVLAVANYPSFDPNKMNESKVENRKLGFISDPIEPGSTFKALTIAAALEHKIARPDTNYYCERGSLQIGRHIINEAEAKKKHEWLSVDEILRYSSNIGTTKIAFDTTFPKLKETLTKFSIGIKTDIEIPGESRGIFSDEPNVPPISLSNISFGQGVATTGIQMLAAYGSFANKGIYIQPTIIRNKKRDKKRVISEQTAEELVKMLVGAVEKGTGGRAQIPHFKIAGKTSTAQRPDERGRYSGYVPGFIGFPVDVKDRFVIYAYVEGPKGQKYYGNVVAAPIFKKVAQYILYKKKDFGKIAISPKTEGTKELRIAHKIKKIKRHFGSNLIPNFIGLDKRSVMTLASKYDLNLVHRGIGVVVSQMPSAGKKITSETTVKLTYQPPVYE